MVANHLENRADIFPTILRITDRMSLITALCRCQVARIFGTLIG